MINNDKKNKAPQIIPVILCGGSGTRLWPLSRQNTPKQFLPVYDETSLLQNTVDRALKCANCQADQIITVTGDAIKKQTLFQFADFEPDAANHLLAEPIARNTAPAVAYAALHAKKNFGDDAIMWILPADHYIKNLNSLKMALNEAVQAAQNGYLVTFGMKPNRAETGYGYIKSGEAFDVDTKVHHIEKFIEKPDLETAQNYLESGEYLWNSGMFVFSVKTILDSFDKYAAPILNPLERSYGKLLGSKTIHPDTYANLPSIPFDVAIMEQTDKAAVIPCDIGWSDVGTWESVWDIKEKNKEGNVIEGKVAPINTKDCLIQSTTMLVATIGVENLAIIENGDSILIADKTDSSAMKTLVTALKKQEAPETMDPPKEKRPWGKFTVLSQGDGFKIKETVVDPGQMMSLQMHSHRTEHITVLEGEAVVRLEDDFFRIKEKDSFFIPAKTVHRIENPGKKPLRYIEVQSGPYLGEDDIVRFDDIYGRAAA